MLLKDFIKVISPESRVWLWNECGYKDLGYYYPGENPITRLDDEKLLNAEVVQVIPGYDSFHIKLKAQ